MCLRAKIEVISITSLPCVSASPGTWWWKRTSSPKYSDDSVFCFEIYHRVHLHGHSLTFESNRISTPRWKRLCRRAHECSRSCWRFRNCVSFSLCLCHCVCPGSSLVSAWVLMSDTWNLPVASVYPSTQQRAAFGGSVSTLFSEVG